MGVPALDKSYRLIPTWILVRHSLLNEYWLRILMDGTCFWSNCSNSTVLYILHFAAIYYMQKYEYFDLEVKKKKFEIEIFGF